MCIAKTAAPGSAASSYVAMNRSIVYEFGDHVGRIGVLCARVCALVVGKSTCLGEGVMRCLSSDFVRMMQWT